MPSAALVAGWPVDTDRAQTLAREFFAEYRPKALISVEARGSNEEGEYHIVNGANVTSYESKMVPLFEEAKRSKTLTIAINDGCGIEIGFGTIADSVLKDHPRYATCQCGGKSGMHDATRVDIVLPAAVCNWGANGIAACLAVLLGDNNILHDASRESRIIRVCADAGAMDGTTGRSEVGVDGLPEKIQLAMVDVLSEIVRCACDEYAPGLKMN